MKQTEYQKEQHRQAKWWLRQAAGDARGVEFYQRMSEKHDDHRKMLADLSERCRVNMELNLQRAADCIRALAVRS